LDGQSVPRPLFEFKEAKYEGKLKSLSSFILIFLGPIEDLLLKNFQRPTVIQSIAWPVAMAGKDLIGIAATGSGKTLGSTLPILTHLKVVPPRGLADGPLVLVLCPTRELAQQVEKVARDYCNAAGYSLTCIFGGAPKRPQKQDLQKGVDMVVATPGRLMDFLDEYATNLNRCAFLVLDEADRMLDMGFEPQIREIIKQIPVSFALLFHHLTL